MATIRRTLAPPPMPRKFPLAFKPDRQPTGDQATRGLEKLDSLIEGLRSFDVSKITDLGHPMVDALGARVEETLSSVFGEHTPRYVRYASAAEIDPAADMQFVGGRSLDEYRSDIAKGRDRSVALLQEARGALVSELSDAGVIIELFDPSAQRRDAATAGPPTLQVMTQRGRLELVDPPATSPLKFNHVQDDLPQLMARLTTALTELAETVRRDNSLLGEVLKKQLIALLETTAAELKAPYTDTSRVKAAADTFKGVAVEVAKRAGSEFLRDKLTQGADALFEFLKGVTG